MRARRPSFRWGLAFTAFSLFVVAASGVTAPTDPQLVAFAAQPLSGTGVCDVTGVHVGYTTEWQAAPAPGRFVVPTATIDSIQQPTCGGATLTVTLRHVDASGGAAVDVGKASVVVGSGTSATATFASPPAAREVDDVLVGLAGGTTPIPPECAGMKLKRVVIGTTGDDTIVDGKGGNLVYGLTGNDTIGIGGQGDCVVVQDGDDRVNGGNGNDVILVDGGANTVNGGNGEDIIHLGNGNGNVIDGGHGTKNLCHVPYPASQLAAHHTVIRRCTVVTP